MTNMVAAKQLTGKRERDKTSTSTRNSNRDDKGVKARKKQKKEELRNDNNDNVESKKKNNNNNSSKKQMVAKQIKKLLQEKNNNNTNNNNDIKMNAKRLDQLRRLFGQEFADLSSTSSATKGKTITNCWKQFLQNQFQNYLQQLGQSVMDGQKTAIRTFWGVIASCPSMSTTTTNNNKSQQQEERQPMVQEYLIHEWLHYMILMKHDYLSLDYGMRHMVQDEFLHSYRDVQYFAYIAIRQIADQHYQIIQQSFKQRSNKSLDSKDNEDTDNDSSADDDEDKQEESNVKIMHRGKNMKSNKQIYGRLYQLLLMIPIVTSQSDLDNATYLFPPLKQQQSNDANKDEDDDEEEGNDDEDDDDSSQDSSSSSSSSSEDEDEEQDNDKKKNANDLKKRFQRVQPFITVMSRAWLAVMRLPLPKDALQHALNYIPKHVMPYSRPNPLVWSDFFTTAFGRTTTTTTIDDNDNEEDYEKKYINSTLSLKSIIISLSALEGLFDLMIQHGLEYPMFYTRLYGLLHPQSCPILLQTTNNDDGPFSKCLILLEKCLCRNEMLPSRLVAAFIKRLLRLAVSRASPPGILYTLALVSNLLRKHPECTCLIHRNYPKKKNEKTDSSSEEEQQQEQLLLLIKDPYNADTNDPVLCRALESSLWELNILERHYLPSIASMAKSIGLTERNDLVPLLNVEQDFLRHSYQSLLQHEKRRGRKSVPVTFTAPPSLFTESDVFQNVLSIETGTATDNE